MLSSSFVSEHIDNVIDVEIKSHVLNSESRNKQSVLKELAIQKDNSTGWNEKVTIIYNELDDQGNKSQSVTNLRLQHNIWKYYLRTMMIKKDEIKNND